MATQVQTLPAPTSVGTLLPALSLWKREIVRFYRQRSRVVGVIISPVLFWIVIGSGFGSSFRGGTAGGQHYLDFFFLGALTMIVLFTSIFAMMSLIEDRNEGFLLTVLVAPVSRSAIVLGKVLGGATLSAIQGLIFLAFAPLVGIHFSVASFALDCRHSIPGRFFTHGPGFRDRVAHGFDTRLSRHHQPVPHTALAALRIALPAHRSVFLDSYADAHQPAHLWNRSLARVALSRQRFTRFPGGYVDFGLRNFLFDNVCCGLLHGQSSHYEACGMNLVIR